MAEPAVRELDIADESTRIRAYARRIDPAWHLPTEAELPCEDDEPLAEGDYQLEPLGYAFYGLRGRYADRPDVAVQADMFVHYLAVDEDGALLLDDRGRPVQRRVAPDVFVSFGARKRQRRSYVVWDEGKPPDFVLEVLSSSTWRRDVGTKRTIYQRMGVREYWMLDPTGDHLEPLQGYRLAGGRYDRIAPLPGGNTYASRVLGLELRVEDGAFRIRDPATGEDLRGHAELREALDAEVAARTALEAARRREMAARHQAEAARDAAETRACQAEQRIKQLEAQMHRRTGDS